MPSEPQESGTDQTRVGHVIEDGDEIDVYAARGSGRKAMGEVPIGKRGWLGNPYPELEHGREGCIEKFREDFEKRLRSDDEFREAIRDLAGQRLGCFCQTLDEDGPACHAEVIAEHADRLASIRADGSGEPGSDRSEQSETTCPKCRGTGTITVSYGRLAGSVDCGLCNGEGAVTAFPDGGTDSTGSEREGLSETEAEDLLHEALMNLDRVRNDYPSLTEELETVLWRSRTGMALAYFRIGREDGTPSLTELVDRGWGDESIRTVVPDNEAEIRTDGGTEQTGKEHGTPNEFRCLDCGHEVEEYRNHTIPLKDCSECEDGRLQHVGPVVDECDECGAGLLYHGNRLGAGTYCDGCFDAIQSALPAGGVR